MFSTSLETPSVHLRLLVSNFHGNFVSNVVSSAAASLSSRTNRNVGLKDGLSVFAKPLAASYAALWHFWRRLPAFLSVPSSLSPSSSQALLGNSWSWRAKKQRL
ncbi:hypothetical protein Q3G72_014082 [Acer saccharum]|nr:hypothetical protein Q3G72_014082 [Acer saccharum]